MKYIGPVIEAEGQNTQKSSLKLVDRTSSIVVAWGSATTSI